MPTHTVRRFAFATLAVFLSVATTLVVSEASAQLWVRFVARQGKLFRPDSETGWMVRSNLDVVRRNVEGQPWRIVTGDSGLRGPSQWRPGARHRVLVLGDSFAFGEGIDLEARFDTIMGADHPEWSIINLGVMGFGTDQEIVMARSYFDELHDGDHVVLLTFDNDFIDIQRQNRYGRVKPWFTTAHGHLVEHPPRVGLWQRLRDRSYLAALTSRVVEGQARITRDEILEGVDLYQALVRSIARSLGPRGVTLVVAHHGEWLLRGLDLAGAYAVVCDEPGVYCLALDERLGSFGDSDRFMRDGHWSAEGHRVVARALSECLAALDLAGPGHLDSNTTVDAERNASFGG